MIRTDRRIRICTVLLVLTLGFIWGNSLLPANLSSAFSDWIKKLLMLGAEVVPVPEGEVDWLRKAAHFTEFAALGGLLAWRFAMEQRNHLRDAVLCGALAACADETIQFFVPGRAPGIWDVVIDTCGVTVGMLLLHFGYLLWRKHQHQNYGGN